MNYLIEKYPIALAVALVLAILFFLVMAIEKIMSVDREVRGRNDTSVINTVNKILDSIGWESKQRWVNDDEIEFVSIVLGLIPEQHKVWARVRIAKSNLGVTVEYNYDVNSTERCWAESVADEFKRRGISAITKCADRQPHPDEIFVPTPPTINEWDSPNPPSISNA